MLGEGLSLIFVYVSFLILFAQMLEVIGRTRTGGEGMKKWTTLSSIFDPQCDFLMWDTIHSFIDDANMSILRVSLSYYCPFFEY